MHYPAKEAKAVFFDLDNVLVFSEVMHFQSWQIVMQQVGRDPSQLDFQSLIGISDSRQACILKEKFSIALDAVQIWEMKRKAFFELIAQGFTAPMGRNHFLDKISNTYITAVVSSSGREVIKQVLEAENISSHFEFIIGHEDCIEHKPNPMPYLLALEKTNLLPHEALIIEDSYAGIKAAKNANIPVIGIFKDQTPDQLFDDVIYFHSFDEVSNWFFNPLKNIS
ncbi:MAG: HAD family phosphatase [Gammaproteobacteria bacterium]|jgi:beta-phosphoglucomutase-like phosphatase (HAD superfamily)|nr:HAD family phosphatase [Gammaproteobacteria bacterium]